MVHPNYTQWAGTITSNGSVAAHGSTLDAKSSTYDNNTVGWLVYDDFTNTTAAFHWYGASPYNAAKIVPSVKWWISGADVSVSLPAGAGFSGSGSAVIWAPGFVTNTWETALNYAQRVHLSAAVQYSAHFQSFADFLLGSTWYHVQGN
ncbi:MAG: hypothetical protein QOE76_2990 [Frankiales bacterium]|jgi:hypothetical protein|nr:hypothetical protein [Frankiales bacterium]